MAEYIDRNQLQTALARKKSGPANGRYTEGWNDCLMRVKSMVSAAPAADVAPVVHGWWIEKTAPACRRYFKCSACGAQENQHTAIKGRFCWSCGARMDGDPDGLR